MIEYDVILSRNWQVVDVVAVAPLLNGENMIRFVGVSVNDDLSIEGNEEG